MSHSVALMNDIVQAHGKTGGEAQEWVRAMLGTVGRGGNAQVQSLPCTLCLSGGHTAGQILSVQSLAELDSMLR